MKNIHKAIRKTIGSTFLSIAVNIVFFRRIIRGPVKMTGFFFCLQKFFQFVSRRRPTCDDRVAPYFGRVRSEYGTYGIRFEISLNRLVLISQHFADITVFNVILKFAVCDSFVSGSP